jgi:hypothetical protein
MKTRLVLPAIVALALVAVLFSCTADGGSIYATIEHEQKINISTLEQLLTILDIVKTPDGQFPYLVAAGAVYRGTAPDVKNEIGWPTQGKDPIAVSPPASGALCQALANFSGNIYGAFFADGPGMGLYKSVPGPNFSFRVADGATAVGDPLVAGKQITLLQVAGGRLFAVVATNGSGSTGFTYDLVSSPDGTNFAATNLTGLTEQITGIGFLGAPSNTYYVTSGTTLYTGAALGSLTGSSTIGTFPIKSDDELRGVTVDAVAGYILIPSKNGDVYYSAQNPAVAWFKGGTTDALNGRQVGFLTVSARVGNNGPGVDFFLIGADGAGYYTLDVANNRVDRFSDVTVTGLYTGAVRKMLVDGSTVFMGTAGTGLWRATFDPALGQVNSTWIHE